jgi:hypothetical protein
MHLCCKIKTEEGLNASLSENQGLNTTSVKQAIIRPLPDGWQHPWLIFQPCVTSSID